MMILVLMATHKYTVFPRVLYVNLDAPMYICVYMYVCTAIKNLIDTNAEFKSHCLIQSALPNQNKDETSDHSQAHTRHTPLTVSAHRHGYHTMYAELTEPINSSQGKHLVLGKISMQISVIVNICVHMCAHAMESHSIRSNNSCNVIGKGRSLNYNQQLL